MKHKILKIHPDDNAIVALADLAQGETVHLDGQEYYLLEKIAAKHKFAAKDFKIDDPIKMYGVLVGKAQQFILKGGLLTTNNVKHATNSYELRGSKMAGKHPIFQNGSTALSMVFIGRMVASARLIIGW